MSVENTFIVPAIQQDKKLTSAQDQTKQKWLLYLNGGIYGTKNNNI